MSQLPRRIRYILARAATAVTKPVDIAIDRIERWAARAPMSPAPRVRVTLVFLQWDREQTPIELEALVTRLRSTEGVQTTVVLVDNRSTSISQPKSAMADFVIPGDNEAWEFSGLQAGVNAARELQMETDLWILANDRYRADGHRFLECLTAPTLHAAQQLRGIVGHIDAYPKAVSSFGYTFREWVATAFLIMSDDVLQRCLPMVRVDRTVLDAILRLGPSDVTLNPPVGTAHARYLLDWLTGAEETDLRTRWYGAAPIKDLDSTVLRRKIQSILNEQLFSANAQRNGIPLVPIGTAFRLGRLGLDHFPIQQEVRRIVANPTDVVLKMPSSARLRLAVQTVRSRSEPSSPAELS